MSDPLSDILDLLEAAAVVPTSLMAGGAWAVRAPAHEGMKFNAVVKGECWLHLGDLAPRRLVRGDCFLLTSGAAFVLASARAVAAAATEVVVGDCRLMTATLGAGDDVQIIGGAMRLDPASAEVLTRVLPDVIVLPSGSEAAETVAWLLDRMGREIATRRPGSAAVSRQQMHWMFVEMIRSQLEFTPTRPGWLAGLADGAIRRSLHALHDRPGRTWTVAELAGIAAMSRSAFAARFRKVVGAAPLEYLLSWRMALARRSLSRTRLPISQIAATAGYGSEAAFSAAFRRIVGQSPGRFRRRTAVTAPGLGRKPVL